MPEPLLLHELPEHFFKWLQKHRLQFPGTTGGRVVTGTFPLEQAYFVYLEHQRMGRRIIAAVRRAQLRQWTTGGVISFYAFNALTPAAFPAGYTKDLKEDISVRLEELGQRVVDRARQLTPKRTGRLARGYRYSVKGTDLSIWNIEDYFIHVEREENMLRRAYNEFQPQIMELIVQDAQNLVRT